MRHWFSFGKAATAVASLSFAFCMGPAPVLAVQGDPIPGVDVSVEQSPSGIIAMPASLNSLKEGFSATVSIAISTNESQNGTVTVTFPMGYRVTTAPMAALSSSCLSAFGFTDSTLTATKTGCTGMLILGGAEVALPVGTATQSSPVVLPTAPVVLETSPAPFVVVDLRTQRQCNVDATKAHDVALRKNASTKASDLKVARKVYNDAIKAAQQAYQDALKKIAADARAASARADASWKEAKNACRPLKP